MWNSLWRGKCHKVSATLFPQRFLTGFACKIKAEWGVGGGSEVFSHASECERLSGNSRGIGHMSFLPLQAETAITGRLVAHLKCRTVAVAVFTPKRERQGVWVGTRSPRDPPLTHFSLSFTQHPNADTHTHTQIQHALFKTHWLPSISIVLLHCFALMPFGKQRAYPRKDLKK